MALKNLPYLFDHVIPNLKHENDGIIFTPVKLPYITGTCRQLYAVFLPLALEIYANVFFALASSRQGSSGSPTRSTASILSSRLSSGEHDKPSRALELMKQHLTYNFDIGRVNEVTAFWQPIEWPSASMHGSHSVQKSVFFSTTIARPQAKFSNVFGTRNGIPGFPHQGTKVHMFREPCVHA